MHDETSIVRRYLPRMPNASSGAELDRGDSICSVSPYDRTNAIVLFQALDDRDVRVIEGREDCGFALETLKCLCIFGLIFRQKLQSDTPVQSQIFGGIDDAHPPAAQEFNNLVMGVLLSKHVADMFALHPVFCNNAFNFSEVLRSRVDIIR